MSAPSRAARILLRWLLDDLALAARHFIRSTLAGSPFMPRIGRYGLYRLAQVRTQTANILPGLEILGPGHHLTIGTGTFVAGGCAFDCQGRVTIGAGCLVGNRVMIVTSDHPRIDGRVQRESVGIPVRIGDGVWIGAGATILPGVVIADGVIIAAGATVNHDCAARGVYAGVPARRVREL